MRYHGNIKNSLFEWNKIEKLRFIDGKSVGLSKKRRGSKYEGWRGSVFISLGIAVQLPKGYEAHVVPRSSTFKNFGLIQTNHMGVIDESYCGDHDEWKVPVMAVRDTCIHVNDRICQFRIMAHQPALQFEEVEHLEGCDRGGFGTTGKQ